MSMTIELLAEYTCTLDIEVKWGEMDALQHVNNVVFFRYIESARTEYFERMQYMQVQLQTGIGPILASTSCKFKHPLVYPDTITVGAKVSEMSEDQFKMNYAIYSHKSQRLAAVADGTIVSYNYREKSRAPIPTVIRDQISQLEGIA